MGRWVRSNNIDGPPGEDIGHGRVSADRTAVMDPMPPDLSHVLMTGPAYRQEAQLTRNDLLGEIALGDEQGDNEHIGIPDSPQNPGNRGFLLPVCLHNLPKDAPLADRFRVLAGRR